MFGPARVGVRDRIGTLLGEIQHNLFERAKAFREKNTHRPATYEEFTTLFNDGPGGFAVVPWDGDPTSEAKVKADTKATIRVLPFGNETEAEGKRCIVTGNPARHIAVFAKSY